jgi:hypothetical protein
MFFGGLIMNKFLITLATLVAFTLSGFAYAQTVSGQMQRIVGVGDGVDGGVAEQFTRFAISADTTADNGWVVGGSMSIQTAAVTGGAASPSTNSMYVQTDMMTVNIGNTVGAPITSVPAVNGMVPGCGVDCGYQFLFDGGNLASQGVGFREAYYASNAAKIDIDLPAVNGFTIGVSYTPDSEFDATTQSRATNTVESAAHGEVIEIAAKYDGEMEGLTYTIGAAALSGNSQSTITGQAARTTVNNDLSSFSLCLMPKENELKSLFTVVLAACPVIVLCELPDKAAAPIVYVRPSISPSYLAAISITSP